MMWRRLPNLIGKYLVLDPKLNHMERVVKLRKFIGGPEICIKFWYDRACAG